MADLLQKINGIILLLEDLSLKDTVHLTHYTFFLEKYTALKLAIESNNSEKKMELFEWNKNYAPRIVYDGVGNEKLLQEIESLNKLL